MAALTIDFLPGRAASLRLCREVRMPRYRVRNPFFTVKVLNSLQLTALRLVIANVAVFFAVKMVWMLAPAGIDGVVAALALPASAGDFIARPWTLLSYMFLHISFWHMLVNVLWLAWFGVLLERVAGWRTVLADYVAGGVAGAFCYMLSAAITGGGDGGTQLAGASAATFAVVTATVISAPDRRIDFLFGSGIPLRWVAVAGLALFACASLEMSATQTAAHCGGIAAGCVSALVWRSVTRRRMEMMKSAARERLAHHTLIEKARRSGYASLTRSEKLRLFRYTDSETQRAARLP